MLQVEEGENVNLYFLTRIHVCVCVFVCVCVYIYACLYQMSTCILHTYMQIRTRRTEISICTSRANVVCLYLCLRTFKVSTFLYTQILRVYIYVYTHVECLHVCLRKFQVSPIVIYICCTTCLFQCQIVECLHLCYIHV